MIDKFVLFYYVETLLYDSDHVNDYLHTIWKIVGGIYWLSSEEVKVITWNK